MRPTSARIRHGVTTTTALVGSVSLAFTATPAAAQALATAHTPSAAHPGLRLAVTVPPPMATLRALETAPAEVTVVPGDTVSDIAARWGLATADVLAWNGLDWSSIIHPGQRLRLAPPAGGANVTPAPAAEAVPAAPRDRRRIPHGHRRRHPVGDRAGRRRRPRRACLLYTSPSPRDRQKSRMPSSA